MIEEHKFGSFIIKGKQYLGDIKIIDKKVRLWDDRHKHNLEFKDIRELTEANPEIIIIGTGNTGYLEVSTEIKNFILTRGIKLLIKKNQEAIQDYNRLLQEDKKVCALFHATC